MINKWIRFWFGFFMMFELLLVCLIFVGCASIRAPAFRPEKIHGEPVKIACIGDSITYGAGIQGRETNSYPAVLGRLLGSKFQVMNFGVSGATLLKKGDLPYWNTAEFREATRFQPKAVIIKLGTNDSKPQNWRYSGEFALDLEDMIEHFRRLPSKPMVWLCLPVPAYEDRWGISEKIISEEIIPIILEVAQKKKCPVIDLYSALSNRPDLFPDKIHPNAQGAELIAKTIKSALLGE